MPTTCQRIISSKPRGNFQSLRTPRSTGECCSFVRLLTCTSIHYTDSSLACVSFTAAMLYGFDMIINGASISMPSFLLYFGEIGPTGPYLPSIWTSLWTAMASLTQAVGSIAIGTISDKYGRKWPSCCASILTMVGTAVQFTAHSREALMGGKMISGFGIGATLAMGITYLAEVRLDNVMFHKLFYTLC